MYLAQSLRIKAESNSNHLVSKEKNEINCLNSIIKYSIF